MSGSILGSEHITAALDWTCDVCIIGSGAGGAVLAAGLAERGLNVVVVEEGGHYTRRDFTLQEADALPAMYQERATRASADLAITVLQGRSLGGSTTVNWTTCFRTPQRILDHWATVHGIEGLDLAPHFAAVEDRLNIHTWEESLANANNRVIADGCGKLGWDWSPLRRNVRACANSGYCGVGCPVDAKQAMAITYVQDAVNAGVRVLANVRVDRLQHDDDRIVAVHGQVMTAQAGAPDGASVVVRPKVTVCSAGALNGPALLLRSGLSGGGLVGKRTFIHPVVATLARFDAVVNPFWGAPQSMGSHHFYDRGPDQVGYFIEAAPLQPMLTAVAFPMFGAELHSAMATLPHLNALLALSVDGLLPQDDGGTVRLRADGRPLLDYPIRPFLQESFRHSMESLLRIQLAAGCADATTAHIDPLRVTSADQLSGLNEREYGAHRHAIFTAHQMGGCPMGTDPARSVVDLDYRFRGVDNLFVVDGSVLPTSLGVNPSETIYALARRAVKAVGEAV